MTGTSTRILEVPTADWDDKRPLEDLREHILTGLDKPVVFHSRINSWSATKQWSPTQVCTLLARKLTVFKICPKKGTPEFQSRFKENEPIFETQCEYVEATFADFLEWSHSEPTSTVSRLRGEIHYTDSVGMTSNTEGHGGVNCRPEPPTKRLKVHENISQESSQSRGTRTNPLLHYPQSQYWVYADYKYMHQLCDEMPEMLSAIDWSVFGFQGRDGKDTTLWVGSEGACTPCHHDTYGCNLVAQLWGRKRWVLFAPGESERLYPTRIPYEESSVFSSVNIMNPDLSRYPRFADTTAFEVVLSPGEVLFVPRHWWHYVECVEPAVSVNTWIELVFVHAKRDVGIASSPVSPPTVIRPSDGHERVKEAVVRTLVTAFAQSQESVKSDWINPNEVLFSTDENLHLLLLALKEEREEDSAPEHLSTHEQLTHQDFVRALTSETVVECVAQSLLNVKLQ